jgi:hypothetical protein
MRGLCLAVALLTLAVGASAQSHRHRKPPRDPKALKPVLRDISAKKAKVAAELRQTKRKANAVVGDIRQVDARLGTLKAELDDTTDRLSSSQAEQHRLVVLLGKATVEREKKKEQVRRRLRAMYMQGNGTVLSVVVGAKSVGDLITRQSFLSSIATKDRELFDSYTRLQKDINDKARQQARVVVRIHDLAAKQKEQTANLEDTRQEKGELLKDLRSKQTELQKMVAQFDQDEAAIRSEIAEYIRRTQKGGGTPALPNFHGGFLRPVAGPITSPFGFRYHPILHKVRMHTGIDFGVAYGTPIRAAAAGRVISAGYGGAYGNHLILDHGGGIMTMYGHCSRLFVSAGQMIRQGQPIGAVGSTGLSTGAHLHFEVWVNGKPVNPRTRL